MAYRLPSMLSVALSRFQDLPPSSVLYRLPLPPQAKPRSESLNLQHAHTAETSV